MHLLFVVSVLFLVDQSVLIEIDNSINGDPEVSCGSNSIRIYASTKNPFHGRIYVKGLSDDARCGVAGDGLREIGMTLEFDRCGVVRVRSLNPSGVFVSATVIISFHPYFLTKVDRAIRLECFYVEADTTVTNALEVSVLPTEAREYTIEMPVCRYEVLNGGPKGEPVRYGIVGQPVFHKWTCDTPHLGVFCMFVHSCFVDDSHGDRVDLILPNGCAVDIFIIREPEYLTDLMAGIETHVFKYADRPQLYFQCQISIFTKEPHQECPLRPCGPAPTNEPLPLIPLTPLPFRYPLVLEYQDLEKINNGYPQSQQQQQQQQQQQEDQTAGYFSQTSPTGGYNRAKRDEPSKTADLDVSTEMLAFAADFNKDDAKSLDLDGKNWKERSLAVEPSRNSAKEVCFSADLVVVGSTVGLIFFFTMIFAAGFLCCTIGKEAKRRDLNGVLVFDGLL